MQGEVSVIGQGTSITGDVVARNELRVLGEVVGNVTATSLHQDRNGSIKGNIEVLEAHLAGHVQGNVKAGTLVLHATARIYGDVSYDALIVSGGATVEGKYTPAALAAA